MSGTRERSGFAGVIVIGSLWGLATGWAYQWLVDLISQHHLPFWWLPLVGAGGSIAVGSVIGMTTASRFVRGGGRDPWLMLSSVLGVAVLTLVATHVFKYQRALDLWGLSGAELNGFGTYLSWRFETGWSAVSVSGRDVMSPFSGAWVGFAWLTEGVLLLGTAGRMALSELIQANGEDAYAAFDEASVEGGHLP